LCSLRLLCCADVWASIGHGCMQHNRIMQHVIEQREGNLGDLLISSAGDIGDVRMLEHQTCDGSSVLLAQDIGRTVRTRHV
jgi:hypothetical protein